MASRKRGQTAPTRKRDPAAPAIRKRIEQLVALHGSFRAVGRVLGGIPASTVIATYTGENKNPSDAFLAKLGLQRVVTYRRIKVHGHDKNT